MNLFSARELQQLFHEKGLHPQKYSGQNFLVSQAIAKRMLDYANLGNKDTIVEIGAGIGNLTRELALRAKRVMAIEKDGRLVDILKETTSDLSNVEIVNKDALRWDPKNHKWLKRYKVVANLPYYISAPLIRRFLETLEKKPDMLLLMVQKEVAQRICAKPPHMNILALSVQIYAKPEIVMPVKKGAFWPQPKVDSAVIKIIPRNSENPALLPTVFTLIKTGFRQPRKQLMNNFAHGLSMKRERIETWLLFNHIQPDQRAETLSLEDWIRLAKTVQ
ncbi:MAG: ribosomal RNA small subunit methyltransferase A [Candidatus Wildermuthbacteria bacterium]|nr:ribosomal RNA small subunit methyltransferase A [Candidatus Wildermuthbacteria bacterium]